MIRILSASLCLLMLASAASPQNIPVIAIPNPFGGLSYNTGDFTTENPFGGFNYFSPGTAMSFTVPNQFGGDNYSGGGFSVPNPFGGMNYYGPGGGVTITVANPFGGYTLLNTGNALPPAVKPGQDKIAVARNPLVEREFVTGGVTTPTLSGAKTFLGAQAPMARLSPFDDANFNIVGPVASVPVHPINSANLLTYGSFAQIVR